MEEKTSAAAAWDQARESVVALLPQDVQTEAWDYPEQLFEQRVWRVTRPMPDRAMVERAVEMAGEAEAEVGDPRQAFEGDRRHERGQHQHHQHLDQREPALAPGRGGHGRRGERRDHV